MTRLGMALREALPDAGWPDRALADEAAARGVGWRRGW